MLGKLLAGFLVDWLFKESGLQDAIAEVVAGIITAITSPITFAWASAFTYYFQGVALIIAIVAIMFNGIRLFGDNGTANESVGHYLWKSTWPLALIAGCPAIFSAMTNLVSKVISDLTGAATQAVDYGALLAYFIGLGTSGPLSIIWAIGAIVVIYYTVTVLFQCVKRQIQLAVLSIIGPLVAASTAGETTAGDFVTILKEMLGIGVITSLQIVLLMSAISLPSTFSNINPFLVVALFASIKHLPAWINRYALAPAVSGGGSKMSAWALMGGRSLLYRVGK
jgi:hypothetical protein